MHKHRTIHYADTLVNVWSRGYRYWIADTYEARHAEGKEPESIDKEFLRLWFRERCDPYQDKVSTDPSADDVHDAVLGTCFGCFSYQTPACCYSCLRKQP